MNKFLLALPLLCGGFSVACAQNNNTKIAIETPKSMNIIAANAKLELLSGDFKFTEGPTSDAKGDVYFTDQPNNRIMKWSTDGKLSTWLEPAGRSNGMFFDAKGILWACADEDRALWRIDTEGKATVVLNTYNGKPLNGPNDVWVMKNGGAYLTDPFYKRDYWKNEAKEQDSEGVYYLAPGATELVRADGDLKQSNGIVGTPDNKTLYVADIGDSKTYKYAIGPDGSLKNKTLFCNLGSDGMTIDDAGNVYLTGKGVTVFNSKGEQIEKIDVPEGWTANVCFGGADKSTLFITASKGLYAMKMNVKGVAP